MSTVAPSPSGSRGGVILQPTYFTSSIFVNAIRDDITTLILVYLEQYTRSQPPQPFEFFKALWSSQGWKWLHFMVFDNRARQAFLDITLRLFLERTVEVETPYSRAIALFGFYTFFYTQPQGTAPPLHNITHIPIQLDHYVSLKTLPNSLNATHLLPLQPFVSYILSILSKDNVFFVIPSSELGSLDPRDLPREVYVHEDAIMPIDLDAPKKKGRPTKRDKVKRARSTLASLDKRLDKPLHSFTLDCNNILLTENTHESLAFPTPTLTQYQIQKSRLLDKISLHPHTNAAVRKANQSVLDRLRVADELASISGPALLKEGNRIASVARVERAVKTLDTQELGWSGGALNLLEGAGKILPEDGSSNSGSDNS